MATEPGGTFLDSRVGVVTLGNVLEIVGSQPPLPLTDRHDSCSGADRGSSEPRGSYNKDLHFSASAMDEALHNIVAFHLSQVPSAGL